MRVKKIVMCGLILSAIIFISLMFVLSNNKLSTTFFGVSFHIVLTNSMSGEIERGDIIKVKSKQIDKISIGENVLFYNESLGGFVIHKVVDKQNASLITARIYPTLKLDGQNVDGSNLVGVATRSQFFTAVYPIVTNFAIWFVLIILVLTLIYLKRKNSY